MNNSSKYSINTKSLAIGYGDSQNFSSIQNNLNLKLKRGELCCLIGPNGVGKSTLLKTLSAQIKANDGDILINGLLLEEYTPQLLAKEISVVLTETIHVSNLKVKELVAMGRFPYTNFWGKLSQEDERLVEEALTTLGLTSLADRDYIELSDGEKQKALIAKALAQNTPIILLDEPTAFLDFPSKMSILAELRTIAHAKNVSIVLSTHDLELALKMADMLWLFPNKNEVVTGIPEDLVLSRSISKAFSNKILTFDLESAHFEQSVQTIDLLEVEGDSLEIAWLKRALVRKGINPKPAVKKDLKVNFNPLNSKYNLSKDGLLLGEYGSIKEILHNILKQGEKKRL